jgi:hypothetical protein
MTDDLTDQAPAHSAFLVLTAIADLGEATAAAIAQHAGLGYSTVAPKLRAWENSGHAEKYRHDQTNQTLWRLASAGRVATATPAEHAGPSAAEPENTAPRGDTDQPHTDPASGSPAEPAAVSPPVEPKPSDVPSTEPQPDPPYAGEEGQHFEGPQTEVVAVEPVPVAAAVAPDAEPDPDGAAAGIDDAKTDGTAARPAPNSAAPAKRKRPASALETSVLTILQSRPDEHFRVNDLRKLVDTADEGSGYPAASAGAIFNALTKLTGKGEALLAEERPATFQAAPVTN